MKKLLLLTAFFMVTESKAQRIEDGWYYFKYPTSNVFGIAYNKPKAKKEISAVGDSKIEIGDSEYIIQDGPSKFDDLKNHWKNIILTSLFNNSNNIQVHVKAYNLKRIILDSKNWRKFNRNNYYISEAIKADSVFININIIDTTRADSKDLEKLISTLASEGTIGLKVIDALSQTEKTSNNGIMSFNKKKKDSLSIVINNPNVYFAAKFVKLNTNAAKPRRKAPLAINHSNFTEEYSLTSNNTYVLLKKDLPEIFSYGATLKLILEYNPDLLQLNLVLYSQKTGEEKVEKIVLQSEKTSSDSIISFDGEYPFFTSIASTGTASSRRDLVLVDYKLDFNPKLKKIIVYGYENGTYETCIYKIGKNFTYWPK